MVEVVTAFLDDNIKIDFLSYFETELKAHEYLRTNIILTLKQSREFIKTKTIIYQKPNTQTGEQEILLDYKNFCEHKFSIKSNLSWHPENMDGLSEFEFKFGDMLWKLFKQYVEFSIILTIVEFEYQIKTTEELVKVLKLQLNTVDKQTSKIIQKQIDQNIKSITIIREGMVKTRNTCIEQYTTDVLMKIMGAKVFSEEDKLLAKESIELSKAEK